VNGSSLQIIHPNLKYVCTKNSSNLKNPFFRTIFVYQKFEDLFMPEDLLVNIKFKNRKTGELKDGYVRVPNIEKYSNGLKKYFDIHEYRICEKRIVSKEEFEKKGKN
jgi:hypothetical protein